jgi:hypothetical protein
MLIRKGTEEFIKRRKDHYAGGDVSRLWHSLTSPVYDPGILPRDSRNWWYGEGSYDLDLSPQNPTEY